ncbi:MAG: glycosyltransferase family 2 protein [Candidatus Omnitrophota bacterium]
MNEAVMGRQEPLTSVIIPTCDRPELLKGAIASVLAQRYQAFEIIVVDDDPAMSARRVALSFKDARIHYQAHERRAGGSAARNTGLKWASGRFIAFLDDDDTWYQDFLSTLMRVMGESATDVGVVSCDVEFVNFAGSIRRSRSLPGASGDVFKAMLCGERSIVGTVALARREVFDGCGGFDEALPSAQDWDMWIRASKKYRFVHVNEVLARVRDCGVRISSDPLRPITSRTLILNKYADDFARHPQARVILLKRLVKLNSLLGRWQEAWRWSKEAASEHPLEWLKIAGWMLLQRPWAVAQGADPRGPLYLAVILAASFGLTVYAQLAALRSSFVINDDVCQHIWWMRQWRAPGLFPHDLLAQYAQSLQHVGLWVFYRSISFFTDPMVVVRYLPFVLFPLAAWAVYRWINAWVKESYTAFLTALAFMVTPIYMQHLSGGHAHTFGYPLLLLFLDAWTREKYRLAAGLLIVSALVFPIIFILAGGYWAYSFCRRGKQGLVWQGPASGERMLGVGLLFGGLVLLFKFFVMKLPEMGMIFSLPGISHMPELAAGGRWDIWPVLPVWRAIIDFMEKGLFVYKAGYRLDVSSAWKMFLLSEHMLWAGLMLVAGVWWWRQRARVSFKPLGILLAVSVLFYVLAELVLLKLYAPDRYVSYSVAVVGLAGVMIPVGMTVASWPQVVVRRIMKVVAVLLVLAWMPLVKGVGLKDYGAQRGLYAFLSTVPVGALIAAFPDTADAVPLFARRSVLISEELSVPLYEGYWQAVTERTKDFLSAYYAPDLSGVDQLVRKYHVAYLVVERHRFSPEYLAGRIYFEPFDAWIKGRLRPGQAFGLLNAGEGGCVYKDKDVCVFDLTRNPG